MTRSSSRSPAVTPLPALVLLLALAGAGCDGGAGNGAAPTVRDSAGVSIVVNRARDAAEPRIWRVEESPTLRIGRTDGGAAYQFHRLSGALRVGDAVVVADAGSGEIRRFDTAGTHLSTVGGAGEGPGEFAHLAWIGLGPEGELLAWDPRLRRLSVFRDGELASDARPPLPDEHAFPVVEGVTGDGTLVASPGAIYVPEERPGVQRPPMPLWLFTLTGEAADTLGPFPGRAVDLRPAANQGWIRTEVPYGPTTLVATGPEGIVVADSESYELRHHAGTGALVRIVRVTGHARPVTEEDLDAELERRLAAAPPIEEIRAGIRASFEATPPAETMPAFHDVRVDAEGYVWARTDTGDGAAPEWHVLDPEGALLGVVRTPAGLRITDIGSDYILGIWTDELDVEHVQMHRLTL